MSSRGSQLKGLLDYYAPQTAFTGGAVPTASIIGRAATGFLDDLESIEPDLVRISKRYSPRFSTAAVAIISRPAFDLRRFAVGIYAWPAHAGYLAQDFTLGSSSDGSVVYHSGDWPARAKSSVWRDILDLGRDAAPTGDFGARRVGDQWHLDDHRNRRPSSTQYPPEVWAQLAIARPGRRRVL